MLARSRNVGGTTMATKRAAAKSISKKPMAKRKPVKAKPAPAKAKPKASPAAKASSAGSVAAYMTASPHTIGRDQTLVRAHELMNKHGIRHLPVLEAGQLVGILSQRDLFFVESLDASSPAAVTVDDAMTQDVSAVGKTTPLAKVVDSMLQRKHGCAVVTDGGKVVGVFSTIDALRVLLDRLR